jgi:hypothetical protein
MDGPGELIAGTYFFSVTRAEFYLIRACSCGEVLWTKYDAWKARAAANRPPY